MNVQRPSVQKAEDAGLPILASNPMACLRVDAEFSLLAAVSQRRFGRARLTFSELIVNKVVSILLWLQPGRHFYKQTYVFNVVTYLVRTKCVFFKRMMLHAFLKRADFFFYRPVFITDSLLGFTQHFLRNGVLKKLIRQVNYVSMTPWPRHR